MGLATHLGPWLLGTVKNTSVNNPVLGQIRNVGPTVVSQSVSCSGSTLTASLVLPAGSQILGFTFLTTTTSAAATVAITVGGVAAVTATDVGTAAGLSNLQIATTGVSVCNNVGTTDVYVIATRSNTTLAGTMIVTYVVRNSDGSTVPSTYTA